MQNTAGFLVNFNVSHKNDSLVESSEENTMKKTASVVAENNKHFLWIWTILTAKGVL